MEKDFQRWTAKRKVELLLQLIKGEATLVDACREHDLKQSEVEGWMEAFLQSGERGLKARSEDEQALHDREVRELRAKVGELVLELDARKKLDALTGKPEKAFWRCRVSCEKKAARCRSRSSAGGLAWRARPSTTARWWRRSRVPRSW